LVHQVLLAQEVKEDQVDPLDQVDCLVIEAPLVNKDQQEDLEKLDHQAHLDHPAREEIVDHQVNQDQ